MFITIIIIFHNYYKQEGTLPVEMEIECKVKDPVLKQDDFEEMDERMEAMMKLKESLFGKAKNNINSAQDRYKKD